MLYEEFVKLTAYEPTGEEWREIQEEYLTRELLKSDFCRMWMLEHLSATEYDLRQRIVALQEVNRELHDELKQAHETIAYTRNQFTTVIDAITSTHDHIREAETWLNDIEEHINQIM